ERLQTIEELRIAEKRRDVNQNVFVEASHLLGVSAEQRQIGFESVRSAQGHAASHASLESGRLVFAEIDAHGVTKNAADLRQCRIVDRRGWRRARREIRMTAQAPELGRELGK